MNFYPEQEAPKGVPVLVSGGVAMKKTGGKWYTGMEEPLYQRELQWTPEWWAPIPHEPNNPKFEKAQRILMRLLLLSHEFIYNDNAAGDKITALLKEAEKLSEAPRVKRLGNE